MRKHIPAMQARRRALVGGLLLAPLVHAARAAERLWPTPAQTEGPFYPDRLPLDRDNDLVRNGTLAPAEGEITHVFGRVLDTDGGPLRAVTVEIWQVDAHGHYIHSGDAGPDNDRGFQGYGRFETATDGQYRFRTIKPVPYPGRTPHIHFKVATGEHVLLTTQLYIKGHPLNDRDIILRTVGDPELQALVVKPFVPDPRRNGELAVHFDIVLGRTPEA